MIKLLIPVVIILLILAAIIYSIFKPNQQTSQPTVNQTEDQTTPIKFSEIKAEDIKIKQPQKPIFAELFAPKLTRSSGYVRLSEVAGKVLIQLKSDNLTDGIAMIYKGACSGSGESVYPLVKLEEGKSQTVWETSLDQVEAQLPLSVKVFKDSKNLTTYTRCADLKSP